MIRELGRGGSATVFLAHDRKHRSQVAIKVIRGGPEDTAQRSRFHQEIVLSAQLRHPYVVPLLDSGNVDGVPYYVMPYVAGESLRQRIDARGALALDEVLSVTRDVAEALDFAHKSGVVHRDIKPQNILLSDGHAFVVDFGIALALERSIASRLTESGLVV
ncbi:MAG: serine/threonine protein kinase, partial [Gemmatimonadetes bacterium]|nr:serine/threonine protein kinase [Gemmatimonadota bacterium]